MSSALARLIAERKASVTRKRAATPNDGRNRYRILPSWRLVHDGKLLSSEEAAKFAPAHFDDEAKLAWAETFFADFGQHFLKDASGTIKAVAICTDKTFGKPCQICSELERGAAATSDPDHLKRLKDAMAGGRVLLNVLALDSSTPDVPVLLSLPPTVFNGNKGVGGIVSLFTDWPNLVSLDKGADIIVEKSGKGMDTRYGVSAVPGKPVDPKVMMRVDNIDDFITGEANPQGLGRAIAHVSTITGLLPAPTGASLSEAASGAFDMMTPTPQQQAKQAAAATDLTDVPDFAAAPAPVAEAPAEPAPVAPAAPAAEKSLEELLAGL